MTSQFVHAFLGKALAVAQHVGVCERRHIGVVDVWEQLFKASDRGAGIIS